MDKCHADASLKYLQNQSTAGSYVRGLFGFDII